MDEKPKVQKVVNNEVKIRKKSLRDKLGGVFFQESLGAAKKYVSDEIIFPGIRDILFDMVTRGFEFMLYGSTRKPIKGPGAAKSPYGNASYVPYNAVAKPTQAARTVNPGQTVSPSPANDIILTDRGEAEAVLETLVECVDVYGQVSRGDLFDAIGMTNQPTDYKWGWNDMSNAAIVRVRDGYLLRLPKEIALN